MKSIGIVRLDTVETSNYGMKTIIKILLPKGIKKENVE